MMFTSSHKTTGDEDIYVLTKYCQLDYVIHNSMQFFAAIRDENGIHWNEVTVIL